MIHECIPVTAPGSGETGYLYLYFLESSEEMRPREKRPVILMCPGGGYAMTSDREAEPMAMQFLAMGYHVAILRYSVAPARYPTALYQLAESVLWLKRYATEKSGASAPSPGALRTAPPSVPHTGHPKDFQKTPGALFLRK